MKERAAECLYRTVSGRESHRMQESVDAVFLFNTWVIAFVANAAYNLILKLCVE